MSAGCCFRLKKSYQISERKLRQLLSYLINFLFEILFYTVLTQNPVFFGMEEVSFFRVSYFRVVSASFGTRFNPSFSVSVFRKVSAMFSFGFGKNCRNFFSFAWL
jgi:hypothetical protein